MNKLGKKIALSLFFLICFSLLFTVSAQDGPGISININGSDNSPSMSDSLQILFLLTVLSLLPSIVLMMTSFTRIIIIFSFVRTGVGLQQTPPNQVLIGLALFLSLFIMSPVVGEINREAYTPFTKGEISQQQAFDNAIKPLRKFMLKQTNANELNLFLSLGKLDTPKDLDEIPTEVIIPAFILSELKKAFIMGFMILIPFLIIDMVVASTLMSMGMLMMPPVMVSLPFKLILFIVVDGWNLIVKTIVMSFN